MLLIGTLLVKQVRAPPPVSHPDDTDTDTGSDSDPDTDTGSDTDPAPVASTGDHDQGSSSGEGDDIGDGMISNGGTPAAPVTPPAEGNEAEIKEEDIDYNEIIEHVSELIDAITSIISDLDDGSSTTISAPLPTAALPCYSVSSIYNKCALSTSVFPNVIFPVQASCLCYATQANDTTATWEPSSYDGYMSSCNDFAQTQTLASITAIGNSSSAFNLCSSAGDVRATPALALPSSTAAPSATAAASASSTVAPATPTATGTSGSANRVSVLRPLLVCVGLWFCRMVM